MKRLLAFLGVAILSTSVSVAMGEDDNLLFNGGFDAEQISFPEFWSASSTQNVVYHRAGGPEGKTASIVLQSECTMPGEVSVHQREMTLVAGETYKLSAYIKTKCFKSRNAGLVVHNTGWTTDERRDQH